MDLQAIGARIRAAREARGLTQSALAARIGVTRSAVAQWETGRSGQVGGNLALVAAALDVGVGHLLLGQIADAGEGGLIAGLTGNERALIELYRGCAPADQAVLLRVAHQLGKRP
jgi:transcriptional regulator with XRE-family HTH domain